MKRTTNFVVACVFALQVILSLRILYRMARTAGGETLPKYSNAPSSAGTISVIVPVLNEARRLAPCLDGLTCQGSEIAEILVVDGGSNDGTQRLIDAYAARDNRIRRIDASPVPADWNGKVWGLHVGLHQTRRETEWILTLDADVRPAEKLARSMLAYAGHKGLSTLSVATSQEVQGLGQSIVHPALLTTLVYRYGIPGNVYARVSDVQANGQCFLVRRNVLDSIGGFVPVKTSVCEDITLARRIVEHGFEVGFYESDDLVSVRMYAGAVETAREWSRSLPMRDRYSGYSWAIGLLEVAMVQALPLAVLVLSLLTSAGKQPHLPRWIVSLDVGLVMMRLGVLAGTRRAYTSVSKTYWLSPLFDTPAALLLIANSLRRTFVWRGRSVRREGSSCA